ncbi:preprotein translocase subunit SecG [Parerythrobacter aurantius]|uniref:preprotein translocase subunit SecG n=1 Tax=Parerythrobacter aurantius TaxID=3127706 RepID=UPI00324CD430
MSLFIFLTVVQAIIAAALVGVVLMQRSEGGGLGVGGSPSGMMSARGAADFLTRTTKWLAVAFVTLSIVLAALAVRTSGGSSIESTLDRTPVQSEPDPLAAPAVPPQQAPGGEAAPASAPASAPAPAPAQ